MPSSIEWTCEEAFGLLYKADPVFTPANIRHYDAETAAMLDTVVLQGVKGAQRLDGVGGNDISVRVIYVSATKTEEELDAIARGLTDAIMEQDASSAAGILADLPLSFFCIEPESTTDRSPNKKSKQRVVTFPVIAKLKAEQLTEATP